VLYSLTRTCALQGVAPLPYLTDVLRKLADRWPTDRRDELLPDRLAAPAQRRYGSHRAGIATRQPVNKKTPPTTNPSAESATMDRSDA
jgi:hypothetical protein